MQKVARTLLALALAALIVSPLAAQDDAKKPEAKKKNEAKRTVQVIRVPKTLELTKEQQEQVAAINKEFAAKFTEAQKKMDSLLTEEQRKARADAQKKAREEMLKGKQLKEAIDAAVNLSEEEQKKLNEAQAAVQAVRKQANDKFLAILTPEQKKLVRPAATGDKKKKKKAKPEAAE